MSKESVHWGRGLASLAFALLLLGLLGSAARASDEEAAQLDRAQASLDASVAEADRVLADIRELRTSMRRVQGSEALARERYGSALAKLELAKGRADAERSAARADITQAESGDRERLEDWETKVSSGGVLLGLLVGLGLGFVFHLGLLTSRPVSWLSRASRAAAAGALAGGTLVLLIIGMGLADASAKAPLIFGGACIGLALSLALVLGLIIWEARRLVADKPPFVRSQTWYGLAAKAVTSGVAVLLCLAMLVPSLSDSKPEPTRVGADTIALARMASANDEPTPRIQVLASIADRRFRTAEAIESRLDRLHDAMDRSTDRLSGIRARVREADRHVARWQAALDKPDPVPIQTYEAPSNEEEPVGTGCDPNYSGCVPSYPPDVDCDQVGSSVSVLGDDPHGLDSDSDGIGCE